MKKLAHYLELRALSYPTEDPSKVKKAIQNILNLDPEKIDEELQEKETESYYGSKITKYTYRTKRWSQVKTFMKRISQETELPENLEKHLNNEGGFYIRFNKQKAYQGKLETTESGDAVHVKVKIASYPFKMKQIKENLRKLIEGE